jgi:pseudouridine-5'-phosphate glycosidase/pseudouridine kinase
MDLSCNYAPPLGSADSASKTESPNLEEGLSPQLHTSNIALIQHSVGGVGHNVALAAQRACGDLSVRLCSYVAEDM